MHIGDKYGILSAASRRLKSISGNVTGTAAMGNVLFSDSFAFQESFEDQMKALLRSDESLRVENFEQMVPEEFFIETNVNSR